MYFGEISPNVSNYMQRNYVNNMSFFIFIYNKLVALISCIRLHQLQVD